MFRKICAMILTMTLFIGCGVMQSQVKILAREEGLAQTDMETVLADVEKRVIIPHEYSEFSYSHDENWCFKWFTNNKKDYIEIICSENGNITSYYNSRAEETAREAEILPQLLRDELIGVAEEYIKLFIPAADGKTEYAGGYFSGMDSNIYYISFNRAENGIPVMDNGIQVGLSAITGELVSFTADWYFDIEIPKTENAISEKQAADILRNEIDMQLAYYTRLDNVAESDDEPVQTFLAYTPSDGYVVIDAFTGEIYSDEISGSAEDEITENITEAETERIEEFGKLLKKDDVTKLITENDRLYMDEKATEVTAELYWEHDTDGEPCYVWRLVFKDPTPVDHFSDDTYRFRASAAVDAETGELLSYNAPIKGYYEYTSEELKNIEIKYSVEERQQIFEEFLAEVTPEKFENIILESQYQERMIYLGNKGTKYLASVFSYIRQYKDIPYSANSIYGGVSALDGRVYRYGSYWNENIEFVEPDDIISEEKAFDKYIGLDGFEYIYEMTYNNADEKSQPEVRLVYRTSIYPNLINAVTGERTSLSGEEYEEQNYSYEYSDIEGHEYERAIRLLADMNIGFKSSKFRPDRNITRDEFIELIEKAGCFSISEEDYVAGSQTLTRQIVAKYGVIACGYGDIAKIESIFTTGCNDEASIYKGYKGYMALALGFGIISADENNDINPYGRYTRGEAAELLLKLMDIVANKK